MSRTCKTCPFNRATEPIEENLGGSSVETYVGQITGPFWLPCHEDPLYNGTANNMGEVKICRGAAKLRSKLSHADMFKHALIAAQHDTHNEVYDSIAEFYGAYKGISEAEADFELTPERITELLNQEYKNYQDK